MSDKTLSTAELARLSAHERALRLEKLPSAFTRAELDAASNAHIIMAPAIPKIDNAILGMKIDSFEELIGIKLKEASAMGDRQAARNSLIEQYLMLSKYAEKHPGSAEKLAPLVDGVTKELSRFQAFYSGQNIDPNAFIVGQGQTGYSDKDPMGTANLHECVVLALYNPETKMTALAHFDKGTDPKSLEDVYRRVRGNTDGPLQARIFGAGHYGDGKDPSKAPPWKASSIRNINEVLGFLSTKSDVSILSEDSLNMMRDGQPTHFVIDPKDFSVRMTYPHRANTGLEFSHARVGSVDSYVPLHVAFDTTLPGNGVTPYFVDGTVQDVFSQSGRSMPYLDLTNADGIARFFKRQYRQPDAYAHVLSASYVAMQGEITEQRNFVGTHLDAQFKSMGFQPDRGQHKVIVDAIMKRGFYVGANEDVLDRRIAEFIDGGAFIKTKGGEVDVRETLTAIAKFDPTKDTGPAR